MKLVTVTARAPFTHEGRAVAAGSMLAVPVVEALILQRQRLVTFTRTPVAAPVISTLPANVPETLVPVRPTDESAHASTIVAEVAGDPDDAAEPAPKRRRRRQTEDPAPDDGRDPTEA